MCAEQNPQSGLKSEVQTGQKNEGPNPYRNLLSLLFKSWSSMFNIGLNLRRVFPDLLSTAPFWNQGWNPPSFLLLLCISLIFLAHNQPEK